MAVHEMKCWPSFFEAIAQGRKRFDLRQADRGIKPDDVLRLREWEPKEPGRYTGRALEVAVTYILAGPAFGLQEGWNILSLAAPGPVIAIPADQAAAVPVKPPAGKGAA